MKKLLLFMLGVLIALPGIAKDFTYEYEGQTLTYTVLDEKAKTCETKEAQDWEPGNNVEGNLVIPPVAKDGNAEYSVIRIGKNGFAACINMTSVEIPSSVTSIGERAFGCCNSLTSVEIPASVTSIGDEAFGGCINLTSVEIPASVTSIGGGTFAGCSSLTSVEIPASVTSIGHDAFAGSSLTSVEIPGSVTSIGSQAFYDCSRLTSVTIQEGIISLPNSCFVNCQSLTEIALPQSLKTIGSYCFSGCPQAAIKFGSNIERIERGAFSSLSQFEGGEKLTFIGDKAFGDNFRLLKINSNTPPQIEYANMGYDEDKAYDILVIVPANSDDVYKKDPKWNGFHIVEEAPTKTVHMTGSYSLAEEIRTTTGEMPANVTSLAIVGPLTDDDWNIIKRNLRSCYDLDLSGVTNTEIPAETFADNMHLLSIKLPEGLKTVGDKAFCGCCNLSFEGLPESIETIGDYAFAHCAMLDVNALPASLKTIGASAFVNCLRLQLKELPAVQTIGNSAFFNCPRFMELDMSAATVTTIGIGTFEGCSKLRNVILPETLTAIGPEAFEGTAINFIDFPENLRVIAGTAFAGTPMISVELPRNFETLGGQSEYVWLWDSDWVYSGSYGCVFENCSKLMSVSLSSKMKTIGDETFKDCRALKSISVPCAVPPTVGDDAFKNVRYRDVVVSIPTTKYRDYLNAPGWGAFTQLSNSLFLDYEEVDENGDAVADDSDAVDAGAIENDTYDEIVDNIVSEEENAAEDAARDEAMYGDEPQQEPAEIAARVQRARAKARAAAELTADAKARRAFTRLYPGQSMTIDQNNGYRVKIEPKKGTEIVKIEFGGKDITDTWIDGMVTLPALYSQSKLKVYRKSAVGSVDNVTASDRTATADVYNLQGVLVLRNATEAQVRGLAPGIYIYKGRKIAIR